MVDTVIAGSMLTSFARPERAAVQGSPGVPLGGRRPRRGRRDGTARRCRRRPFAGHIEPAMNFADALRRLDPTAEITGLDRPALRDAARQRFGRRPDGPVLMVTGGSQAPG